MGIEVSVQCAARQPSINNFDEPYFYNAITSFGFQSGSLGIKCDLAWHTDKRSLTVLD